MRKFKVKEKNVNNNKPDTQVDPKDVEIAKLKASLEEANKKLSYQPEPAKIPVNQLGLPRGIQESQIKTTVTDISTVIKNKLLQLKDLSTMEVMLDPFVRMRNRLDSVKKMSSAQHIKVRGIWKTIKPEMYVSNLQGKKVSNDEMRISFGVYDVDPKGNKKLFVHYAEMQLHDGSKIQRPTSAEYRIAYEVIETIKSGKPISREVIRIDRFQQE